MKITLNTRILLLRYTLVKWDKKALQIRGNCMKIFDKVWIKPSDNKITISGLYQFGSLLFITTRALIILPLPWIFSLLFYPIDWTNFETWVIIILVLAIITMGFGYKLAICSKQLRFYETYFFFPVLKVKEEIEYVQIKINPEASDQKNVNVIIEYQNDPWSEFGFSDWVQLRKGSKVYDFGTNKNHKELLNEIFKSVEKMKLDSSKA